MQLNHENMKCDWCGDEFPADARACVESGIDAYHPPEEGEEWKGDELVALTTDQLPSDHLESMKAELGLDDAQLAELLATGTIEGLGAIVCLECQNGGSK